MGEEKRKKGGVITMAITAERIREIMKELISGGDPKPLDQEEAAFIESARKDIALAEKNGWIISVPGEWEV